MKKNKINKMNTLESHYNEKVYKNVNNDVSNKNKPIEDSLIQLYLNAIDKKNKKKIKIIHEENNQNNINRDIVYDIFINNKLNCERLQFIVDSSTIYLNISSTLITKLLLDNNKELLEILFKNSLNFSIIKLY